MFEFITTSEGKITMQLNYKTAKENGVDISASLLEIIKIVGERF